MNTKYVRCNKYITVQYPVELTHSPRSSMQPKTVHNLSLI
jgi:hypothetical protein